jgi:hypothetical protein
MHIVLTHRPSIPQALYGQSMQGPDRSAQLEALAEEDESEEAEVEQHKHWQRCREVSTKQRMRDEMGGSRKSGRARGTSWRARKKNDAENERLATEVVDDVFEQLGLER